MRITRAARVAVTLGAAGLASTVLTAPGAAAAVTGCRVTSEETGASYAGLQAAQDAASAGDTLVVRGTCAGAVTLTKNLSVTGERATGYGTPTLEDRQSGTVLSVGTGLTVSVSGLTITGGKALFGGGVGNDGTLALNDTRITGNTGKGNTGGIYNNDRGVLTLTDSVVSGNTGGGIVNTHVLTLQGSIVSGNTTAGYGGGVYNAFGTLTVKDSRITANHASGTGDGGGGIFSYISTLTVTGSVIAGNTTAGHGGGVWNGSPSRLTLGDDVVITGNTASLDGGGIWTNDRKLLHGAVPGPGGNVYGNRPDDIS